MATGDLRDLGDLGDPGDLGDLGDLGLLHLQEYLESSRCSGFGGFWWSEVGGDACMILHEWVRGQQRIMVTDSNFGRALTRMPSPEPPSNTSYHQLPP